MAKNKKNQAPSERLKALKGKQKGLLIGEIGCVVAPFGILTIFNFNEFFIKTTAWKTSITFVMLAVATFIGVLVIAKEKMKVNLVNSFITLAAIDGILWFMGDLINKLAYILLYVIVGFIGALILELRKRGYTKELQELEEGIQKARTDIIADEYKQEQQTVKVRIK